MASVKYQPVCPAFGVRVYNDGFLYPADNEIIRREKKTGLGSAHGHTSIEAEYAKVCPTGYERERDSCALFGKIQFYACIYSQV